MLLVSRDILLLQGEDEASEEQQDICGPKLWIQEVVVSSRSQPCVTLFLTAYLCFRVKNVPMTIESFSFLTSAGNRVGT